MPVTTRQVSEAQRTRVKICGLTRLEDAITAAYLGADAVGLVFAEASPRFIQLDVAARIAAQVPAFVTIVGLFVDASAMFVEQVLRSVRLDLLQFHGNETPRFCEGFNRRYIKAVRMAPDIDLPRIAESYAAATALLVDAYVPGQSGGTGQSFDWRRVPQDLPMPIVLAGGITPSNVTAALTAVRPYSIDVSSGVEFDKGIKDDRKMAALMRAIYQFDQVHYAQSSAL